MSGALGLALALGIIGTACVIAGVDPFREARHFLLMRRYDVMAWILDRRMWAAMFGQWLRDDVFRFTLTLTVKEAGWALAGIGGLFVAFAKLFAGEVWNAIVQAAANSREYARQSAATRPKFRSPEWRAMIERQEAEFRYQHNIWRDGRPPVKPSELP